MSWNLVFQIGLFIAINLFAYKKIPMTISQRISLMLLSFLILSLNFRWVESYSFPTSYGNVYITEMDRLSKTTRYVTSDEYGVYNTKYRNPFLAHGVTVLIYVVALVLGLFTAGSGKPIVNNITDFWITAGCVFLS
jgi:hypothetical protein